MICWKNQDTCGLSDCIYHYSNTSPHEDIYKINTANQLEVNGKVEQFGLDIAPEWVIPSSWASIEEFFDKWGLKGSGPSKEECERILEQARRNREKKTEKIKKWLAENPLDK